MAIEQTLGAAQQLFFQFVNYAAEQGGVANVIYITSDQSYNKLQWQIILNTGTVTLKPATIIDPTQLPPVTNDGTLIYLSLAPLGLSDAIFNQLVFSADNWTFKLFPDVQMVGMTPSQEITLTSGTVGMQVITVSNIEIPTPLQQPTVDLTTQIYDTQFTNIYGNFKVALQPAPSGGNNLQEYIQVALSNTNIINSYQADSTPNSTQLIFAAGAKSAQILAGPDSVFNISFVYGQVQDKYGFGALTTTDLAKSIRVTRLLFADAWQIIPDTSAQNISWNLIPPSGKAILGSGAGATVSFEFDNIITNYQPGPTVMLLSYQNIPGYQDGVYTILLNKIGHVVISTFTVSPNPTYVNNQGKAPATVSWQTNYATALTLTQNWNRTDVTGKTSVNVDLDAQNTTFTLTAQGQMADQGNQAASNVNALALPSINNFTGQPTEIYYQGSSHQASFSWAVQSVGSSKVMLTSTGNAFGGGTSFDNNVGSASTALNGPQMVTLLPQGDTTPLALRRNLVISAFNPIATQITAGTTPTAAVASPGAPFIAVSDSSNNQLVILDTVKYAQITTVPVGAKPGAIAFSADGSIMMVANSADNSVTPISVSLVSGLPSFSPQTAVSLNGSPVGLILSPAGDMAYVVVNNTSSTGTLVALKKTGNSYQNDSSVSVGNAPSAIAALHSGAAFYIANSGDDSVSIVGISSTGKLLSGLTINNVGKQPSGIAIGSNEQLLLVSCAGDNSVVAIDIQHPNTGSRNTVSVGKQPGAIAITPSSGYAFVCNSGDGTLSMLDCWGSVADVKVVGQAINTNNATPVAISVSPDGLSVFSANSSAGSVTLVSLTTYQSASAAISLGDHMTNAAVSPDKSQVFVWQNRLMGSSSTPGIIAYNTSTGAQQSLLSSLPIIACVFNSQANLNLAYALDNQGKQLYQINSQTLQSTNSDLPLPSADYQALSLGISADSNLLFATIADTSNNVSLLIMNYANSKWNKQGIVSLYQASTKPGFMLVAPTLDASQVVIVDPSSQTVYFCTKQQDGSYLRNSKTVRAQSTARGITILPDGSTAYILNSGAMEHDITVVDMVNLTGTLVTIPQKSVALTSIVSSPDGRRLYATDANAGAVRILDPASLRILQTITLASGGGQIVQNPIAIAIAYDASSLYVVNNSSANISVVEQIQMQQYAQEEVSASSYSGIFVRDQLGQLPDQTPAGWSSCPDIIFNGNSLAPDPSVFTTTDSYNTQPVNNVYINRNNYIYLRGRNTNPNGAQSSHMFFYYTESDLMLWPTYWRSDHITVNAVPQNWSLLSASAYNEIAVTTTPLLWVPPPLGGSQYDHYCVIAWADNNATTPTPPDFSTLGKFSSCEQLAAFVQQHPNMGWCNTNDIYGTPPNYTYNTGLQLQAGGGVVNLSISFINIPADGTFNVNLQGTNSGNTIIAVGLKISDYQGGFNVQGLAFPPNFTTSLQVEWFKGATNPTPAAQVKVSLTIDVSPLLIDECHKVGITTNDITVEMFQATYALPHQSLSIMGPTPVSLVGRQTWNMFYGVTPPNDNNSGWQPEGSDNDVYNGMFLRQYMGQKSADIPNSTDNWLFSPDLLVYGTNAAYDTSNFNSSESNYESRNWYFSQPPTPGKQNYIYERAISLSPNLTSTVYLFYCDATTLLQPKNWKSDTFQVTINNAAPVNQNYFTLNAVSLNQLVTSYDAVNQKGSLVTWAPPATDSGAPPHYYLIAWVANSNDGNTPPPFSTLGDFSDLAALENYVKSNPQMTMLDTWYNGIFLRQQPGQTNYQESLGTLTSPDLIVTNTSALHDTTSYSTQASYNSSTLNQNATYQLLNFIYVRGLNTEPKTQDNQQIVRNARVYLYYTTSDQPSPAAWKSDTFYVAGDPCNYIDISAYPGDIVTSYMPVVWQLDTVDQDANYILIAYVDDSGEPQPPDFSIFGYINMEMIEQFVATQPRMTWLQINGSRLANRPDSSAQLKLTLPAGESYAGLQFSNIPTSGTVNFSLPGIDSSSTLVINQMHVPDPNAAVTWPLNLNAQGSLPTSLIYYYWSNGNGTESFPEDGPINISAIVLKPEDK